VWQKRHISIRNNIASIKTKKETTKNKTTKAVVVKSEGNIESGDGKAKQSMCM